VRGGSVGDDTAEAWRGADVVRLLDAGHGDRVLLSHDVFLKVQLRAYGGNRYGHVLRSFLPRLAGLGVDRETVAGLLTANPRLAFEEARAAM
jgi:phosphotriesterase-related protein